jgi:hypothetical protein
LLVVLSLSIQFESNDIKGFVEKIVFLVSIHGIAAGALF